MLHKNALDDIDFITVKDNPIKSCNNLIKVKLSVIKSLNVIKFS